MWTSIESFRRFGERSLQTVVPVNQICPARSLSSLERSRLIGGFRRHHLFVRPRTQGAGEHDHVRVQLVIAAVASTLATRRLAGSSKSAENLTIEEMENQGLLIH